MKLSVIILGVLAVVCFLLGKHAESSGGSADEKLACVFPYGLAFIFAAVDVLLLIGWGVYFILSR